MPTRQYQRQTSAGDHTLLLLDEHLQSFRGTQVCTQALSVKIRSCTMHGCDGHDAAVLISHTVGWVS